MCELRACSPAQSAGRDTWQVAHTQADGAAGIVTQQLQVDVHHAVCAQGRELRVRESTRRAGGEAGTHSATPAGACAMAYVSSTAPRKRTGGMAQS